MWIHIQRLDFVPLARISGAAIDVRASAFRDDDLADDLATLTREMQSDRARGRRFASIVDLSGAPGLNAKQRTVLGGWIKETEQLSRLTSISIAFVAPSAILRGVLTAVLWMQSFGVPHRVCATLDEAIAWSLERIRDTGLQVPDSVHRAVKRAFSEPRAKLG